MKDINRFLFRYFLITFTWSWIFWVPLALGSQGIILVAPKVIRSLSLNLSVVAAFGPLIGAITAIRGEYGKGSVIKYLRSFLDLRLGWKAWLFPFLILGVSTLIAWLLPEFFGGERLKMLLPSVWLFFPYLLLMMLLGGGQEEFGWRGYALSRLEKQLGLWRANILLGIIWACWHLPLWFITDTNQSYMNFGGFILLTVGYSFTFSWIRNLSGNKPFSGLLVHGVANAFMPFMPVLQTQKDVPQPRFWIWVSLSFLVGIIITLFRQKIPESQK